MEELASLIPIIIIAVISAISNAAKNKKKQQPPYQGMNAARPPQSAPAARPVAPAARPAAPAAPVQKPAAAPAAPQQISMASMLPQEKPAVARPMVHPHIDPDCDVHDAPTSGSLNVISPEGKDPCHTDQLPARRTAMQEPAEETSRLQLDWSGDAMVRAFVMQEVLTRPCDRRRR